MALNATVPKFSCDTDPFEIAHKDKTSLGNILIAMGFITSDQLEKAIAIQLQKVALGEILVQAETITRKQLAEALMQQRIDRGEASVREELTYYRRRKHSLVTEIVSGLKKVTETSESITKKLTLV